MICIGGPKHGQQIKGMHGARMLVQPKPDYGNITPETPLPAWIEYVRDQTPNGVEFWRLDDPSLPREQALEMLVDQIVKWTLISDMKAGKKYV